MLRDHHDHHGDQQLEISASANTLKRPKNLFKYYQSDHKNHHQSGQKSHHDHHDHNHDHHGDQQLEISASANTLKRPLMSC